MGEQRFFEIDEKTKVRLGFYKDETGDTDIGVNRWYLKVGDVIKAVEDSDTGSLVGENIVEIEAAKGSKDIEGVGWEIGARIVEILISEGEEVTIDLSKGDSLKLAILEVEGDAPSIQEDSPDSEAEPEVPLENMDVKQERESVPVSPAARKAARERGIDLDEVRKWLPSSVERVEVKHLDEFTSRGTSGHEAPQESEEILAAPATRALARERDVDLAHVVGTGPGGIVLPADLDSAQQDEEPEEVTAIDRPGTPGGEETRLSEWEIETYGAEIVVPTRQRLAIARNLGRTIAEMVLVGEGRDLKMSPLNGLRDRMKEDFQKQHGIKLRFDHFFLAAVTQALKVLREEDERFKRLNARWQWDEDRKKAGIVLYEHINLALAVSPPDGLVTPVIMHCEEKTFVEIAFEAERLIARALEGKLRVEEVIGMTFTVNNAGVFGGEFPDPVPNPDTAAIIAFGAIQGGKNTTPQLLRMVTKFDHQILDAREVGGFMGLVKELLENPEQLLTI